MKYFKTFLLGSFLSASLTSSAALAEEIRMLINQSPWLNGFIAMVDEYEKQSDNTIELDVTPFGGMLEKTRNSIRGSEARYDLIALNAGGLAEHYSSGFMKPLTEIDPNFKLEENLLKFGGSVGWDRANKGFSSDGEILGVPINGNVQVLYYRTDLYEAAGLTPPETWDELIENAKALADENTYGYIPRASRGSIMYNFTSCLLSHGGSYFADPSAGDYNVTIASKEALNALNTYIRLGQEAGPPNPGSIAQAELIQLLSTGKAAQAIAVIAAYANLNNPNSSIVAGKIGTALIPSAPGYPHASSAGHWQAGIPKNAAKEKQVAALHFLNWFQQKEQQLFYVRAGGVPVRKDLAESGGDDPAFDFIPAFSANAAVSQMISPLPEGSQIKDAISVFLNQAVIGELTPTEALNKSADAMHQIMIDAGYKVSEPSKL